MIKPPIRRVLSGLPTLLVPSGSHTIPNAVSCEGAICNMVIFQESYDSQMFSKIEIYMIYIA